MLILWWCGVTAADMKIVHLEIRDFPRQPPLTSMQANFLKTRVIDFGWFLSDAYLSVYVTWLYSRIVCLIRQTTICLKHCDSRWADILLLSSYQDWQKDKYIKYKIPQIIILTIPSHCLLYFSISFDILFYR